MLQCSESVGRSLPLPNIPIKSHMTQAKNALKKRLFSIAYTIFSGLFLV
jgi:hypothetical protein